MEYEVVTEWHAATVVLNYAEAHRVRPDRHGNAGARGRAADVPGQRGRQGHSRRGHPRCWSSTLPAGAFSRVLGERPGTASRAVGADTGVLQNAVSASAPS